MWKVQVTDVNTEDMNFSVCLSLLLEHVIRADKSQRRRYENSSTPTRYRFEGCYARLYKE